MRTLLLLFLVPACTLDRDAADAPAPGGATGVVDDASTPPDGATPADASTPPDDSAAPAAVDDDGDGHPPRPLGDDCDDTRAAVHPGAIEICGDGVDQDCLPSRDACAWTGVHAASDADTTLGLLTDGSALLGGALLGGHDVTGDGVVDLVVGAPGHDLDGVDRLVDGVIYVASGAALAPGRQDADRLHARLTAPDAGAAGASLALARDAAGRPRLLAGAPYGGLTASASGLVVRGPALPLPAGDGRLGEPLGGFTDTDPLGLSIAVADLDGTGGDELLATEHGGAYRDALVWADVDGWLDLGRLGEDGLASVARGGALQAGDREVLAVAAGPGAGGPTWSWAFADGDRLGLVVLDAFARSASGALPDDGGIWYDDLGAFAVRERGASVAHVPDVTGDGVPDVLLGLPCRVATCIRGGDVYVLPGGVAALGGDLRDVGDRLDGTRLIGDVATTRLGTSVAFAGDVDGDGQGDLLVGEPRAEGGRGAVHLLYGPVPTGVFAVGDVGAALPGVTFRGEAAADELGGAVGRVGDVDGDGRDEIALAATHAPSLLGRGQPGRVYVVRGRGE